MPLGGFVHHFQSFGVFPTDVSPFFTVFSQTLRKKQL
jgi:hypothetical protein